MKKFLYICIITIIISYIFINYPQIDILVSSLFYSDTTHQFYLKNNNILKFISESAYYLAFLLLAYNSVIILITFIKTRSYEFMLYRPQVVVLLVFFIGSVLLVQCFSKHYFGRARPYKVTEFSGNKKFTPAFTISNQCKLNCSFVSFHTSIGILFLIYSFYYIGSKRKLMITCSYLLTILFALTRIIQGKHFLSDVVISACFMFIIYYLIELLADRYSKIKSENLGLKY